MGSRCPVQKLKSIGYMLFVIWPLNTFPVSFPTTLLPLHLITHILVFLVSDTPSSLLFYSLHTWNTLPRFYSTLAPFLYFKPPFKCNSFYYSLTYSKTLYPSSITFSHITLLSPHPKSLSQLINTYNYVFIHFLFTFCLSPSLIDFQQLLIEWINLIWERT